MSTVADPITFARGERVIITYTIPENLSGKTLGWYLGPENEAAVNPILTKTIANGGVVVTNTTNTSSTVQVTLTHTNTLALEARPYEHDFWDNTPNAECRYTSGVVNVGGQVEFPGPI